MSRPTRKPRIGGERWRGKLPVPEHAHPLVRDLVRELNEQRTTISEMADRAAVCRQAVRKWQDSTMPRVDLLDACFNALGYRLAVVPVENTR